MAEGTKIAIDPSALAAALAQEAENFTPHKGTVKDILGEPEVFQAVRDMEARGMTIAMIAQALIKHGVNASPGTIKKKLQEVKREAKGGGNGKAERKPKATNAKPSSEATKEVVANRTATSGATGSGTAEKPTTGTHSAKPAETDKGHGGGASKKPTMAANIDPSEL